jgi:3-oxoacyl-[acyl-carrier-protein] synthase II
MAMADAGWAVDPENRDRTGVYVGSGIGGFATIEREHSTLVERGPSRVSPFFIPACIVNLASGWISIRTGAQGPNSATATACTTSAHAVGDSFRLIQRDDADVMIAGGSEAAITPLGVAGFAAMRALTTRNDEPEKASRPFDRDRDGFLIGEGSGILVLEELEHAKRRGARVYCELVGYGMSADAFHISAPCEDGSGAIRVMRRALRDAKVEPSAIGYVNVHGTSTPAGDMAEVAAIKAVFGEHAKKLAISSTKSMTGHLLGAAGGLEAGISALAIKRGVLPPTINHDNPDPACDVDVVPNVAREVQVDYALSNSFGFGGTNGALVFKRFEG